MDQLLMGFHVQQSNIPGNVTYAYALSCKIILTTVLLVCTDVQITF